MLMLIPLLGSHTALLRYLLKAEHANTLSCMSSTVVLGTSYGIPGRSLFCSVLWFILQITAAFCTSRRSARSNVICIRSTAESCCLPGIVRWANPDLFFFKKFWWPCIFAVARGSLAVGQGLSCPTARGILVPQPGVGPTSLALEGEFLTTRPPGKSQPCFVLKKHLA